MVSDLCLIQFVQFDYISPDLYVQYSFWQGVINKGGVSFGTIMRFFPIKPIKFMLRIGGRIYADISFVDLEARMGVMIWRFEIFGGYRHIQSKLGLATLSGPVFGSKFWF